MDRITRGWHVARALAAVNAARAEVYAPPEGSVRLYASRRRRATEIGTTTGEGAAGAATDSKE